MTDTLLTVLLGATAACIVVGAIAVLGLCIVSTVVIYGWADSKAAELGERRRARRQPAPSVHDLPPPPPAMTTTYDVPTVILRRDELDLARAMRVLDEDGVSR